MVRIIQLNSTVCSDAIYFFGRLEINEMLNKHGLIVVKRRINRTCFNFMLYLFIKDFPNIYELIGLLFKVDHVIVAEGQQNR